MGLHLSRWEVGSQVPAAPAGSKVSHLSPPTPQQGVGAFRRCPVGPDLCPHGPQVEATEPQDVVVYDQSTRDASVLAADSFLSVLLSKLDGCFASVAILTGELRGAVGHPSPLPARPGRGASGESGVWAHVCSSL